MKNKYFLKSILTYSLVLFIVFSDWTRANVRESIRLENYILRQVESYLSRVLPSNSYLATVSVDAVFNRTQEVKNETVNSYLKEENITPPPPPTPQPQIQEEEAILEILPGLENLFDESPKRNISPSQPVVIPSQEPTRNFREEENKTSREYTYNDQIDIREVSVQVAFDDSLTPALVQSVKNLIASKMDITFGDKATVIFSTVDLDQVRQDQTQPDAYPPPPLIETQPSFPPQTDPEPNLDDSLLNQKNGSDSFGESTPPPVIANPASNTGWEYYLDKYDSIFYLLLSVFIIIVLLLLFIFFLWLFLRLLGKNEKKEEPKNPPPPSNLGYPLAEPAIPITLGKSGESSGRSREEKDYRESTPIHLQDEINSRAKEERFLDQFLKEPLLSRKYFLSLPEDDKNELLSALVSNAIKTVFRDIANDSSLGQDSIFQKDLNPEEIERTRDQIFSKHIDGINQFNKIYASQIRDPFSKLSFFTEEELKTIFNSVGMESAVIIAKNVDSQKMVPYLNQLPEQRRKEFLRIFNSDREISAGEMDEFKRNLRIKTDDLSRNIFIRKADNKFIKRKLLESSVNKKEFLKSIKNDDPDLYHEYRGYMVDFNDFLADTGPLFNRTIQSLENEEVSLALIGVKDNEARNRILSSLPEIRKEFISSYVASRQNTATREDIENNQNRILEIYRNFLI